MEIVDFSSVKTAEDAAPAAENLLAGDPKQQVWNAYSDPDGRFHVGRWASTPGKWRVRYTEAELCHILSGVVRLTSASGAERSYSAGSTFVIPRGFEGTWEVVERCAKIYAIYE